MTVRNTSIEIYNEMVEKGIIGERQSKVFDWLREFRENLGFWPTAAELSEYLDHKGVEGAGDPNFVRPRLTELKKELHLVGEEPRRSCFSRQSGHPHKISRYPSERPRVNREVSEVDWDSLMKKVEDGDLPEEEFKPGDHDSDETGQEQETDEEQEESEEFESGDVIYGGDDDVGEEPSTKEDSSEEDEEQDSISIEGTEYVKDGELWVSENGEDYVFPPGKDEDDYDLDEYGEDLEPGEENQKDDGGGKEEKETSLNQY